MKLKKPELLAPAGNLEKLKTAVHFGADAVYFGGKNFSLRNYAGNFSFEEMEEGINFAKKADVKTYITCNIFPKTKELKDIGRYLSKLRELRPDALIIADPGILKIAGEYAPEIPIHLSTQANTTNSASVNFWKDFGVSRVNLARELSLQEIKEIKKNTDLEIESFIHGAMCISYSGRCLLSSFMSGRSSNHGECAHPCRWKYRLEEELRPGEYYPVSEDNRGTYIFNSKDLNMLRHIDKLIEAGIDSLKIEGRMKGLFYLGSVVKVYREAIDTFFDNKGKKILPYWEEILNSVANRIYCTGFYMENPDSTASNLNNSKPDNVHNFLGKIEKISENGLLIGVRNKIVLGENIKILSPKLTPEKYTVEKISDIEGNSKEVAQPNQRVIIKISQNLFKKGDLVYRA